MSCRKRYAAIGLALAAVAVPATTAVAMQRGATVQASAASAAFVTDREREHEHVKLDGKCVYPPQKTPHVDLKADDKKVKRGERTKLEVTVWVNDREHCGIKNFPVALYQHVDGAPDFTFVGTDDTNKSGQVTFRSGKLTKTTSFYVVTPGGLGFDSQQSKTVTVTVRS